MTSKEFEVSWWKMYILIHKILFFKTSDRYTSDTKGFFFFKKTFLAHESKSEENSLNTSADNYHQHRTWDESDILPKIILNVFKCLPVSFPTKIITLAIAPLSFISVNILCKFATLSDVRILVSPQEEKVHSFSERTDLHIWLRKHPLPIIILVCLGNIFKTQDCKTTAFSLVLLVQTFDKFVDELGTTQTRNSTVLVLIIRPKNF